MSNNPRLMYYHKLKNFSFENYTTVSGNYNPDNWSKSVDGDGGSTWNSVSIKSGLELSRTLQMSVGGTDSYVESVSDSVTEFTADEEYAVVLLGVKETTDVSGTLYLEGLDSGDAQTEVSSQAFTLSETSFDSPEMITVKHTFTDSNTTKIRVRIRQTTADNAYYDHVLMGILIDMGADYNKYIAESDEDWDNEVALSVTEASFQLYTTDVAEKNIDIEFPPIFATSTLYNKIRTMFEDYVVADSMAEPIIFWEDKDTATSYHYLIYPDGKYKPKTPPGLRRVIISLGYIKLPWGGFNDI